MNFPRDLVRELEERAEVRIETEEDSRRSSVIIWVVVTPDGVYVRSYRGPKGIWYRRMCLIRPRARPRGGYRAAPGGGAPPRPPPRRRHPPARRSARQW